MNYEQLGRWLESALRGRERLPKLTPDEANYLGVLRVQRTLASPGLSWLVEHSRRLVAEFCRAGVDDVAYVEELLSLAAELKDRETTSLLAALAGNFSPASLSPEIQLKVLATLVDTSPSQTPEFWRRVLAQHPARFSGMVLSGILATYPFEALDVLLKLPDTEAAAAATVGKLELTWDALKQEQRFRLVEEVSRRVPACAARVAQALRTWTEMKRGKLRSVAVAPAGGPASPAPQTDVSPSRPGWPIPSEAPYEPPPAPGAGWTIDRESVSPSTNPPSSRKQKTVRRPGTTLF